MKWFIFSLLFLLFLSLLFFLSPLWSYGYMVPNFLLPFLFLIGIQSPHSRTQAAGFLSAVIFGSFTILPLIIPLFAFSAAIWIFRFFLRAIGFKEWIRLLLASIAGSLIYHSILVLVNAFYMHSFGPMSWALLPVFGIPLGIAALSESALFYVIWIFFGGAGSSTPQFSRVFYGE